jgi:hypothetical protein
MYLTDLYSNLATLYQRWYYEVRGLAIVNGIDATLFDDDDIDELTNKAGREILFDWARKLKKSGKSTARIEGITGLTIEEIEGLFE